MVSYPVSRLRQYLQAFLISFMWIKVLYLLRLNRVIGPLLKILARMAHDIFIFMVLSAFILVTFSWTGMILFRIPEF